MTHSIRKMPSLGGIGAGETATLSFPLGLTYHQIMIRMNVDVGDPAVATDVPVEDWGNYIDEIRLDVNGENTFTMSAEALVQMNKHNGAQMIAGVLPIFLSRPWAQTAGGQDQTAYKTAAGVDTFTIEIDQKDGITVNSLEIYARQSAGMLPGGQVLAWGPHLRVQRFRKQQGLVGPAEIADIPRNAYHLLALHVDTDKIERAEVVINNTKVVDVDKVTRDASHLFDKRTLVAGHTFLNFDSGGRLLEAMPMAVQDARFKFDFTEAGNYYLHTVSLYPG